MGRAFKAELSQLSESYLWAKSAQIDKLSMVVEDTLHLPLVSVGSGGSLTAAARITELHSKTGRSALALTPMQFARLARYAGHCVHIVSARGKNADAVAAAKHAIIAEPRVLSALTLLPGSPLDDSVSAYEYGHANLVSKWPFPKDGFLAVNSLLATCVLLGRAYSEALGGKCSLPKDYRTLEEFSDALVEQAHGMMGARNWIILYGPDTYTPALDLESKLIEGALRSCQLADYRNFAHGRHNWIRRFSDSTGVLAFANQAESALATRTLELIPGEVPRAQITLPSDSNLTTIAGLIAVFRLVAKIGAFDRLDPGKPVVAAYQRRLFHLRRVNRIRTSRLTLGAQRKLESASIPLNPESLSEWEAEAARYRDKINNSRVKGIVFDYDGTLCSLNSRFDGISSEIAEKLIRLLQNEIEIGIATGRGKSVREQLHNAIPKIYWPKIIVGYYNGSTVRTLAEELSSDSVSEAPSKLSLLQPMISDESSLRKATKIKWRPFQITVEPRTPHDVAGVFRSITEWIEQANFSSHFEVLTSSHSIDIIPRGVSKLSVVEALASSSSVSPDAILAIGDRGAWPGNDFKLLSHSLSLSCDQVSLDKATCWNFSPAGCLGSQAAANYLNSFDHTSNKLQIEI